MIFIFTPMMCSVPLDFGVSKNASAQLIISAKFLKHRKLFADFARTFSRLGIKTNFLKYSAIARNQERNILEQFPSETLNLIAKYIARSPSLKFIIVNKNS